MDSISDFPEWAEVDDNQVDEFRAKIQASYDSFQIDQNRHEADTETELIWPILEALGWTAQLTQQNLSVKGRDDVPDVLLFENEEVKAHASSFPESWKRYEFGSVVVESKRWTRPLDRRSGRRGEETAPSTQMLRYLRRIDDITNGKLRWGILTNGAKWRLYFSGARSVSEQFFEIDLAFILNLPGFNDGLLTLDEESQRHWLKVFFLAFRRDAFVSTGADPRTFHEKAIDEGKFYEERVAENLSNKVFGEVFPELVQSIAKAAPKAEMQDVREGALILLYRLLFIFYAEDRDLLPVKDTRYDDYGLRQKVRLDVGKRKDDNDTFSNTAARYWGAISDLFLAVDKGDSSIGLPPYNGGLFQEERTEILTQVRIPDSVMAQIIDALSFEQRQDGRKYINYRNLSVQQLGSIYERLLEFDVVDDGGMAVVRPNIFARKGSGSYYTPDDLVQLILKETITPLIEEKRAAFSSKIKELQASKISADRKIGTLKTVDPASNLLAIKICDPAMGSGHFLVSLVDFMADQIINAMADVEHEVPEEWGDYISPLSDRIDTIRNTILANADDKKWTINEGQLDDRHIIRRMILKRCVYGVDKNQMAVELAKVSLWLHTFTAGAPLSFLDHHLRCGNSLFGSWVNQGVKTAKASGTALLLHGPIEQAIESASKMQLIENLTDAEIAEAHRSADIFKQIQRETAPLDSLLTVLHALSWLGIRDKNKKDAIRVFYSGQLGDPLSIAMGNADPDTRSDAGKCFSDILAECRELIEDEKFINWQVAFPSIWSEWEKDDLTGGFDAIIGNPPWDRMKLQQVEWFADRKRDIALTPKAADRKRQITELIKSNDPLAHDYIKAVGRTESAIRMARKGGDYPLLAKGDINLYSLFVERAMTLVKRLGYVGLIVPSGIASDKTASVFFKSVATAGRLHALYDFENRRTRYGQRPFFENVDSRFKFCAFIASPSETPQKAKCAFFLQSVTEIDDPEKCFNIGADDFERVNPNTGTAPIFRSRRDAELTKQIYSSSQVLVNRTSGKEYKAWPVKYMTMFHMTNDSDLFRTKVELEEEEAAYPIGKNKYENASGIWSPLYVGKMIHHFDHRAATVKINEDNVHNAAISVSVSVTDKKDVNFSPESQYWVLENDIRLPDDCSWTIAFRDIARATDARTMISTILPRVGANNKVPLLVPVDSEMDISDFSLLVANFNSIIFDFVARQKVQSTSLNWYIVEQLPVVPRHKYDEVNFGGKTVKEIIKSFVLRLTYTASDLDSFARDMGHVDKTGEVLPPFEWDEENRLLLKAKLDAVYFYLYGMTDREDIRYIYSTFPIIEREEKSKYDGVYRSRELCLAYMNALKAGKPDAEIKL